MTGQIFTPLPLDCLLPSLFGITPLSLSVCHIVGIEVLLWKTKQLRRMNTILLLNLSEVSFLLLSNGDRNILFLCLILSYYAHFPTLFQALSLTHTNTVTQPCPLSLINSLYSQVQVSSGTWKLVSQQSYSQLWICAWRNKLKRKSQITTLNNFKIPI